MLELRQWQGGDGGSGNGPSNSIPRSRIIYNPTHEPDQLLQLTFVQPLRLKRGALRRALAAEAAVTLELTAFTQAGRTCIQLQHVLARVRPAVSGKPRSSGCAAVAPNAELVKCGAMLEEVIIQLHARRLPTAGSGVTGWPRLLMHPGMMNMPHIIDSREVEHIYCRCDCCCALNNPYLHLAAVGYLRPSHIMVCCTATNISDVPDNVYSIPILPQACRLWSRQCCHQLQGVSECSRRNQRVRHDSQG